MILACQIRLNMRRSVISNKIIKVQHTVVRAVERVKILLAMPLQHLLPLRVHDGVDLKYIFFVRATGTQIATLGAIKNVKYHRQAVSLLLSEFIKRAVYDTLTLRLINTQRFADVQLHVFPKPTRHGVQAPKR